jgi:hypothetical protein
LLTTDDNIMQSNPVITTSFYAKVFVYRQIFFGTSNPSLLAITEQSSVRTTFFYNGTQIPFLNVISESDYRSRLEQNF